MICRTPTKSLARAAVAKSRPDARLSVFRSARSICGNATRAAATRPESLLTSCSAVVGGLAAKAIRGAAVPKGRAFAGLAIFAAGSVG